MISIIEKLDNDEIFLIFKELSTIITKKVKNKPKYLETINLFFDKDDFEISDSDVDILIDSIINCELEDLKRDNNYLINLYIETVFQRNNVLKRLREKGAFKTKIKNDFDNLFALINESEQFKERFFEDIKSEEISEINSKKKCTSFMEKSFQKFDEINEKLGRIFDYDTHISREIRVNFILKLKVNVCPYCNYNTIPTSIDKVLTEADIDHFLPKSIFPLFGLSYGNFIPSCKACNSSVRKGVKTDNIINPRFEKFGRHTIFKFELIGEDFLGAYLKQSTVALTKGERESLSIVFQNQGEDNESIMKINNSISLFGLKDKYNNQTAKEEIIKYIIDLRTGGSKPYNELLEKLTGKDLKNYIFKKLHGIYNEEELEDKTFTIDYVNTRYSKLKSDIIDQYLID